MKKLFGCANGYIQARDWKMLTLLKFCLFAIGILIGVFIPPKYKKIAFGSALAVFIVTYVPLMADFVSFALNYFRNPTE